VTKQSSIDSRGNLSERSWPFLGDSPRAKTKAEDLRGGKSEEVRFTFIKEETPRAADPPPIRSLKKMEQAALLDAIAGAERPLPSKLEQCNSRRRLSLAANA
jgi:hypothetical protein